VNEKHIAIRIEQCIALAKASNCPRRKFGALLLDPVRNVIISDGYNGGPRGGGHLCGGAYCLRDGVRADEIEVRGPNGVDDHDVEDAWLYVRWVQQGIPVVLDGKTHWKTHGWRSEVLARREVLLSENQSIPSGQQVERGCHHAEMNVICNAAAGGVATRGAWLIVTGEPCLMCAKLIHHAGIEHVLCVKGGYAGGSEGPEYLTKHKVQVEYVEGPPDPRTAW